MASIAGASPTTSAANPSGPTRRRPQELDPEKSLQTEDEVLHEAHDIDRESHGYQLVNGSIRALRELFGRRSSSSSNDIVGSSKGGASRISKQMWRWGVVPLLLFAMAVVGVLELSRIGGSHEESTRFLFQCRDLGSPGFSCIIRKEPHHKTRNPDNL